MDVAVQAWRPEDAVAGLLGGRAGHRVGTVEQRRFPIGTGAPDLNLSFSRDTVADGFYSPRHRHCWDQLRFVLSGTVEYDGRPYPPGSCFWLPARVPPLPLSSRTGAELWAVSLPRYAP